MKTKDNQITGKVSCPRLWSLDNQINYHKVVKHIPIEVWSEIKPNVIYGCLLKDKCFYTHEGEVRNQGGRTYLVTVKENK